MKLKIESLLDLMEILPPDEALLVDVLRELVYDTLNDECKEKLSYNVPYFYGNKGICIIWPSTIPRGGIKEGVLFGFWYGCLLDDPMNYLDRGSNKQIYYKIYKKPEDIDVKALRELLLNALKLDRSWKN